MNGIRFYLEFSDKSKHQPGGTVVAALVLIIGFDRHTSLRSLGCFAL